MLMERKKDKKVERKKKLPKGAWALPKFKVSLAVSLLACWRNPAARPPKCQRRQEARSCPVGGLHSQGPQISPQAWGGVSGMGVVPGWRPNPCAHHPLPTADHSVHALSQAPT